MPTVHETAYPRLKSSVSPRELTDLYTPTVAEVELAGRASRGETARLGFLVLLKTFQRLGYFVALRDVLLGIELMPRIRNWKSLDMCRPDRNSHYDHIDSLFTENVDWSLIETHLPDMLRVALSIKSGRISASTILRRLGTYSRKNRLYQAFCELGRVIRTGFLLRYISDSQLRSTIQGATNKREALNRFLKWTFFGGEGVIAENSRDEQRKAIKYNHLVAN